MAIAQCAPLAHSGLGETGPRAPAGTIGRVKGGVWRDHSRHVASVRGAPAVRRIGAVEELGYYVAFAGENGEPLSWLQTLESLAVNALHAVVVEPVLTRIEMLRIGRNYELSITRRRPVAVELGRRPKLKADEVFYGVQGYLSLELWGKDKELNGFVKPQFFTRSGEEIPPPPKFEDAIAAVTRGTACIGYSHPHYSRLAVPPVTSPVPLPDRKNSFANDGISNASTGPEVGGAAVALGTSLQEMG